MTTGEKIRILRKKKNLTQKKLAELSGVAEITIRKYESGENFPRMSQMRKIAFALGVGPGDLLFSDDFPTPYFDAFGDWLNQNGIEFKPAKWEGLNGKFYSIDGQDHYNYFLTDEQIKYLPEAAAEYIKTQIQVLSKLNESSLKIAQPDRNDPDRSYGIVDMDDDLPDPPDT